MGEMPGTTLLHGPAPSAANFERDLIDLRHDERYDSGLLVDAPFALVGESRYPAYPMRTTTVDGHRIVVEGRFYGRDGAAVDAALASIVEALDAGNLRSHLAEWLPTVDGDFVITVLDPDDGSATVINDYLGRLPLYYAETPEGVVVSREKRFVVDRLDEVKFDRMALAHHLLFGYTVGEETTVRGVRCVPPASILRIDGDGPEIERVCEHSYGRDEYADRSRTENATRLADRFDEACRARSETCGPSLVSLSGGLDSRAILASYAEQGLPHIAATMDYRAVPQSDVDLARALTDAYGTDWYCYEVDRPDATVMNRQLKRRNGRNTLAISYLTSFFDRILADHGTMPHLVGAGGDKVFPDLSPPRSLADVDDLVDQVIDSHGVFDLDTIEAITGVPAADIRESLRDHLAAYPESDPDRKYVHFVVHERGMNWIYEGEDTNRYYFWSLSPFWSTPVFRYAMNCPPAQKRYYRLYGEFLATLSERAVSVPNANFGVPPNTASHTARAFGYRTLLRYPGVWETLKPAVKRFLGASDPGIDPDVVECIRQQLDNPGLREVLSRPAVERVLDDPGSFGIRPLFDLLTLTSYVDDQTASMSVLDEAAALQSAGVTTERRLVATPVADGGSEQSGTDA